MADFSTQGELELHVSPVEKQETTEEFVLVPSPAGEQDERFDLTLEADSIYKAAEITFDGEAEAESRIEEAMKAYDAAMDDAAGLK